MYIMYKCLIDQKENQSSEKELFLPVYIINILQLRYKFTFYYTICKK